MVTTLPARNEPRFLFHFGAIEIIHLLIAYLLCFVDGQVPEGFRFVVQAALREFYLSIAAEKDQEQSWKKAIYKVIARLDEVVPEYFKSSNWLEQLADC